MSSNIGANAPAPVDIDALQELKETVADNIPEIMVDLIDTFIEDSGKHLQDLVDDFATGKYAKLEIRAHSLKSSAATFGAQSLADKFARMERLLREGKVDEAQTLLEPVQKEFAEVVAFLEEERAKLL